MKDGTVPPARFRLVLFTFTKLIFRIDLYIFISKQKGKLL